jgi:hypothetical protein
MLQHFLHSIGHKSDLEYRTERLFVKLSGISCLLRCQQNFSHSSMHFMKTILVSCQIHPQYEQGRCFPGFLQITSLLRIKYFTKLIGLHQSLLASATRGTSAKRGSQQLASSPSSKVLDMGFPRCFWYTVCKPWKSI